MSKVLDYAALQDRGIKYSKPHLWRMWTKGKFPKPFKLTPGRNVWRESDINEWLNARISEHDDAVARES
jgi:prophage regulatory protein